MSGAMAAQLMFTVFLSAAPLSRYDINDASVNSIMLLRALDPSSDRPLHEQVAASLRRAIVEDCKPGDRLPTASDVAAALGVNANTALRALRSLRDEGVVEFRRGRGITVASRGDERGRLSELVAQLLFEARRSGFTVDEVIEMMREQE